MGTGGGAMRHTGVFASPPEIDEARRLAELARTTPVIALSGAHALRGGFSGEAWRAVQQYVHRIALAHGLPEIPGYYGLAETGEFVESG